MQKLRTFDSGRGSIHTYHRMRPEQRPQDPYRDGTGLRFQTLEHHGWDVCPEVIYLTDAQGRSATYQVTQSYSDDVERPTDRDGDGSTLKIETADYGGECSDDMPQRLRVTDSRGRSCDYESIREDGRVVIIVPPERLPALVPELEAGAEVEMMLS